MVNNPGIGPDGGPLGAGKYDNGANAAGYYYDAAGYHTQAMEDLQNSSTAATRAWETQINTDFPNFFKNWGFDSLAEVQAGLVPRTQLRAPRAKPTSRLPKTLCPRAGKWSSTPTPPRIGAFHSTLQKRMRSSRQSVTRPWPNSWRRRRPMLKVPAAIHSGSGAILSPRRSCSQGCLLHQL